VFLIKQTSYFEIVIYKNPRRERFSKRLNTTAETHDQATVEAQKMKDAEIKIVTQKAQKSHWFAAHLKKLKIAITVKEDVIHKAFHMA
jgi:hypothetical protein